jgi:hypothetical protein
VTALLVPLTGATSLAARSSPLSMVLVATLSVVLTFVLGALTALAFVLVGGRQAILGSAVVFQEWPLIYALVAMFAATAMLLVGLTFGRQLRRRAVVGIVIAAWFGQYVVLASGVLANELTPLNSIYVWLLATGGPIQAVAGVLGGVAGQRFVQKRAWRSAR